MKTYIYLGIREYASGLNLSYDESTCMTDEEALKKTFEGLKIYKIINPSPLPGKIPCIVVYHRDPDNELSQKYWPK